jgi:catechol 2,3-dioxygenase-like lactoylglutathione lyase family enzyme
MIEIDHIALPAHDPSASARFLADLLGLRPPEVNGPDGDMYRVGVGSSFLLFARADAVAAQHMAFRVDERAFRDIVARLAGRGQAFGNDPEELGNGLSSDPLGGLGRVYFVDPNGHLFEVTAA